MSRKLLAAAVPCAFAFAFAFAFALTVAGVAVGAAPASLPSPGDAFETAGALALVAQFAPAVSSGVVAKLVVEVEDCGTFTYTSTTAGEVTRTAGTSSWAVDVDLATCRGESAVVRTHHCDGYGNTFETCESDGEAAADRAVKVTYSLKNRAGVDLCSADADADGAKECAITYGTLLADTATTELYVPAPWWTEDAYGWSCLSRSEGSGARDPSGQSGSSCEDLGL